MDLRRTEQQPAMNTPEIIAEKNGNSRVNSSPERPLEEAPHLLVLVPCLNEQGRIGRVICSVRRVLPGAAVVVIDDASSDESSSEARSAGAIVLSHGCQLGYGAALETGYAFALKGKYDIVLQMDGDGQHLADELPKLLTPLQEGAADIVLGSRHLDPAGMRPLSPVRRIGQLLFSGMMFLFSGLRLSDPTSGFQGLTRDALRLFASGVFPCDYPDTDVLLMARMAGLRIRETPVSMEQRAGGKSMHSGFKPLYYGIKMFLSMGIVLLNFREWLKWRKSGLPRTR